MVSSLVGASTTARRPSPLLIISSSGTAKAMLLPLPVSASIMADLFSFMIDIACIYTGVGLLYPHDLMVFKRYLLSSKYLAIWGKLNKGSGQSLASTLMPNLLLSLFSVSTLRLAKCLKSAAYFSASLGFGLDCFMDSICLSISVNSLSSSGS